MNSQTSNLNGLSQPAVRPLIWGVIWRSIVLVTGVGTGLGAIYGLLYPLLLSNVNNTHDSTQTLDDFVVGALASLFFGIIIGWEVGIVIGFVSGLLLGLIEGLVLASLTYFVLRIGKLTWRYRRSYLTIALISSMLIAILVLLLPLSLGTDKGIGFVITVGIPVLLAALTLLIVAATVATWAIKDR